jgi:hypothetical protein
MDDSAQQAAYYATRRLGATANEIGGGNVQWHQSITTPGATAVTRDTPREGIQAGGMDTPNTGVSTITASPQNATRLFTSTTPQVLQQQVRRPATRAAVAEALRQVIAASDLTKKHWEFTWQKDSGANGSNDLKEELLCTEEIQCFAMAREGTSVVSVVHGLRKCFYAGASTAVKGKVFGRLGEWTAETQPLMVEMQPGATWSWEKVDMATSEVQWANFCAGRDTGGKLWQPAANLQANMIEEKVHLPRLLYLPAPVALFAVESRVSIKVAHGGRSSRAWKDKQQISSGSHTFPGLGNSPSIPKVVKAKDGRVLGRGPSARNNSPRLITDYNGRPSRGVCERNDLGSQGFGTESSTTAAVRTSNEG